MKIILSEKVVCYICVFIAMLQSLLCKSCVLDSMSLPECSWKAKTWLGLQAHQVAWARGTALAQPRESLLPTASPCVWAEWTPARWPLGAGGVGRSGRTAVPGSAGKPCVCHLRRPGGRRCTLPQNARTRRRMGWGGLVPTGAAFSPLALHRVCSPVSVTWWQSRGWVSRDYLPLIVLREHG